MRVQDGVVDRREFDKSFSTAMQQARTMLARPCHSRVLSRTRAAPNSRPVPSPVPCWAEELMACVRWHAGLLQVVNMQALAQTAQKVMEQISPSDLEQACSPPRCSDPHAVPGIAV